MTANITNQVAYLRTSRNFPLEAQPLAVEVNRSYVDIAEKVNSRIIGIFPDDRAAITGESWFVSQGRKQQTLRQAYTFSSFAAINHELNTKELILFTRIFGGFTDGTNFYPLPYVHPTAANQVGVIITATQITFAVGGSAPTPTNGVIVLEWLSQF